MEINLEQCVEEIPEVLIKKLIQVHGLSKVLNMTTDANSQLMDHTLNLLHADVCEIIEEQAGRINDGK